MFERIQPHKKRPIFGSPEYEAMRQELERALDHPYAADRHHPEHFKNGVAGMNLIDVMEMVYDWVSAAAAQRSDSTALSNLFQERGSVSHRLTACADHGEHDALIRAEESR